MKKKRNFKIKFKKSTILAFCLLIFIPSIIITGGFGKLKSVEAVKLTIEDLKTAADISNMTGVKLEDIKAQKERGYTWNEILDKAKTKNNSIESSNVKTMSTTLATTGLDDSFVKELNSKGFRNEEITATRMLVERVQFQLKDIIDGSNDLNNNPNTSVNSKSNVQNSSNQNTLKSNDINISGLDNNAKGSDELEAYKNLSDKIDLKKSVELLLKLKGDFGSYEQVLDEYLYSLQIGISLEDYLTDSKAYKKEKEEKSSSIDTTKILTLAKIEAKYLECIQESSNKNNSQIENNTGNTASTNVSDTTNAGKDGVPTPQLPEVNANKVENPASDVMKEIDDINNRIIN